jgi:FdhD protein
MRTPGADFELAAGFLLAEGVISGREQLGDMRYCGVEPQNYNVVDVDLEASVAPLRTMTTSSSCGVCGSASIDSVTSRSGAGVAEDRTRIGSDVLTSLPDRMREAQRTFASTGGLHAAGLFDAEGGLVAVREDVGRHNAFDKLIGWSLLEGRVPLAGHVLLASGRASFELVQKALAAGAPVLAAISAPSSLAVDLAERSGLALVGFLRGETMNVYTHDWRIT